jgi:hypothetical protein
MLGGGKEIEGLAKGIRLGEGFIAQSQKPEDLEENGVYKVKRNEYRYAVLTWEAGRDSIPSLTFTKTKKGVFKVLRRHPLTDVRVVDCSEHIVTDYHGETILGYSPASLSNNPSSRDFIELFGDWENPKKSIELFQKGIPLSEGNGVYEVKTTKASLRVYRCGSCGREGIWPDGGRCSCCGGKVFDTGTHLAAAEKETLSKEEVSKSLEKEEGKEEPDEDGLYELLKGKPAFPMTTRPLKAKWAATQQPEEQKTLSKEEVARSIEKVKETDKIAFFNNFPGKEVCDSEEEFHDVATGAVFHLTSKNPEFHCAVCRYPASCIHDVATYVCPNCTQEQTVDRRPNVNSQGGYSHFDLPDSYAPKYCPKCGTNKGCMCPRKD